MGFYFFVSVPKKKESVEFEIVEKQKTIDNKLKVPSLPKGSLVSKDKSNGTSGPAESKLSLSGLTPKLNFTTRKRSDGTTTDFSQMESIDEDTYEASPLHDNSQKAWGSGAGTFARVKDYLLYKKIYEHVDNSLHFPSLFHRHKIEGAVNARIVINEQGRCDWKKTMIKGTNDYLQIYVLSVLRKACTHDYRRVLKNRLITNVDLSFQFELTEDYDKEWADRNRYIIGNTLLFYRNSVKSIMEWEFGPFKGVFPLPVVNLNVEWIKENWDKFVNSKDPIVEFKKEFGG